MMTYNPVQTSGTIEIRFLRCKILFFAAILFIAIFTATAAAQIPYPKEVIPLPPNSAGEATGGHTEWIPMPTLGGMQFWSDELIFHDWHIQQNVATGHCRLIDGSNLRHGWGTFDQCRRILEDIKKRDHLQPMKGKAIIVIHGLFSFRPMMTSLTKYLKEKTDYTVIDIAYPSSQRPIAGHAQSLGRVIENLQGIDEIYFVAHSLGNIVLRQYLGDHTDPKRGITPDRRIKRIVMLAPPNHGSRIATKISDVVPDVINTLDQLGKDWKELEPKLATPACPFGIIAGGKKNDYGYNIFLTGDDDGTVTVESTRLAGASDFVIIPSMHTALVFDETAHEYTLRFLQHGYFISAARRNPILSASTN